ncbi:MAG: two-component system regulatory protein YycI [Peptoniphilaceae bacterium]
MDWSKSKVILIIALLITNLVLFSYISIDQYEKEDKSRSKEFITKTTDLLAEKNINLAIKIPKNKISLPSLKVEFETYPQNELNKRFFDLNGSVESPNNEFTQIKFNTEIISILNTRRLIYENTMEIKEEKDLDFNEVQNIAKIFLLDRGFDVDNMEVTYVKKEGNKYNLSFSKLYDGIIIERSFTNFIIDNGVVTAMDRLWLNVLDKSNNQIELVSAPKALLSLLEDNTLSNKTITNIGECFYFDPEEQGYVEDITKVMEGRAIPAWRIQFDDGENTEVD